ncbi:hypothetical protein RISK_004372 [Rhodopirellula islandica]|uniref:Uncharacterized protein n=1 Tax=Rhodopirellula islandica TaxID=595434 RepID=A0A0J1BAR2_RHOIS|nr:hypothetical protein RISK_004372 [Rhodopirellula islandica]
MDASVRSRLLLAFGGRSLQDQSFPAPGFHVRFFSIPSC